MRLAIIATSALCVVTGATTRRASRAHPSRAVRDTIVTVPIQFEEARVYVPVVIGGRQRWFILDTGAYATLVDSRVADSVGLPTRMTASTTGAGGRSTHIGYADGVSLTVGSVPLGPQKVTVAALDSVLAPSTGRAIPGIIGSRFFREHVVELDFAAHTMRLHDPATFEYRGNGIVVPLTVENDIPYTMGWIVSTDGTRSRVRFLVDLGAKSNALITEPFANAQQLARHARRAVTTEFGAGMGGETSYSFVRTDAIELEASPRTRVDSLVVGLSVGGTLGSSGFDALLGADYLARFRVIFDYSRQRMLLEPRSPAPPAGEFDMSGLFLVTPGATHGRIEVKSIRAGSPASAAGVHVGDLIDGVDELRGDRATLARVRERLRAGDGRRVTLHALRDGTPMDITMELRRVV